MPPSASVPAAPSLPPFLYGMDRERGDLSDSRPPRARGRVTGRCRIEDGGAPMGAIAGAVTVYGVVMALAPALQVRRMLRERSAAGVSLAYAVVLWAGFALWLAYGIDAGDLPLILANTVALGATGAMILVTCRVRRAELRRPAASAPPRG